jgi:hypothetical protein
MLYLIIFALDFHICELIIMLANWKLLNLDNQLPLLNLDFARKRI